MLLCLRRYLPALLCRAALQEEAAATGLGDPEQLDLRQEAKINSLELAVLFSERTALLSARAAMPVHTCPGACAASALCTYAPCTDEGR